MILSTSPRISKFWEEIFTSLRHSCFWAILAWTWYYFCWIQKSKSSTFYFIKSWYIRRTKSGIEVFPILVYACFEVIGTWSRCISTRILKFRVFCFWSHWKLSPFSSNDGWNFIWTRAWNSFLKSIRGMFFQIHFGICLSSNSKAKSLWTWILHKVRRKLIWIRRGNPIIDCKISSISIPKACASFSYRIWKIIWNFLVPNL